MSFYSNDDTWSGPGRQSSWGQDAPPSRSGTGSALSHQSDAHAFASQFEEIERASDNLLKSRTWTPPALQGAQARRDSMPAAGRGYDYAASDSRAGGSSRHQSISEYDGGRPGSAGLQGYYAGQRFPPRQSEAEQMLQAKRRMAAQRERELRNYHQEQQYNRNLMTDPTGVKTDRSMSPTTMSEDDRRELIARQHRALYGDNSSMYGPDGAAPRQSSQDVRAAAGGRGQSPLAFDPYAQAQPGADGAVQMPPRDRATSTASPASNPAAQQSFALLNEQSSRTSNSSPGGSPPLTSGQKGGVAPIGTRPVQAPGSVVGLSKRSTTPMTPSSLSYGFTSSNDAASKDDRSGAAAASAQPLGDKSGSGLTGGWNGSNGGVWGSGKGPLGVQASVWG
ncbi:hypothetical protein K431DRAFT_223772 [Polychaeton citri CBS 116435]|uniref:Uncharacterized protein n=1 Tax=Polychaeton citri CBS 116435 TaxID=1314669 RepID=A0A9P4Q8E8_9PEZI|nr:hypothetical protein K431DRAFT_223772 [Polychaeton citri CBS 116435]